MFYHSLSKETAISGHNVLKEAVTCVSAKNVCRTTLNRKCVKSLVTPKNCLATNRELGFQKKRYRYMFSTSK